MFPSDHTLDTARDFVFDSCEDVAKLSSVVFDWDNSICFSILASMNVHATLGT